MAVPKLPWYGAFEKGLAPFSDHLSFLLVLLALVLIWFALKAPNTAKLAFLVYLVSP